MKASGFVVIVSIFVGLVATGHLLMLPGWFGVPFSAEEIVLYRGAFEGPAISLYIADVIVIGVAVAVIVTVAVRCLAASRRA